MHKSFGSRLDMSIAYHPQMDGQTQRTIQTLEDMLRAREIDFDNGWEGHLPLVEFSHNNSYHTSIQAAPSEALYRRKCQSPLCWSTSWKQPNHWPRTRRRHSREDCSNATTKGGNSRPLEMLR
ncbi:putative nucleotidyltransferase, Ribonuclease H [Helianthus debilis subsp. tardiflorus]